MIIHHEREKLLNAIIYFSQNTNFCGKVKLFKLLYFLDFNHYKRTGRSVTGLYYHAWKMGPVPTSLAEEIDAPSDDFKEILIVSQTMTSNGPMVIFQPKKGFDPSHFSPRELKLMEQLMNEFKDTKAEEMIEKTHLENLPWFRVYNLEGKKQGKIPYHYALSELELEEISGMVKEDNEILENYS